MIKQKILIGVPPKRHVKLAQSEIEGLIQLGFICRAVTYGNNSDTLSTVERLFWVVINAFQLVSKLYSFSPQILYLNSRFEPVGCVRDFVSILILKTFYYKRLRIMIKSHGSDHTVLLSTSFFYAKIVIPFLSNHVYRWFFLSQEEVQNISMLNKRLVPKLRVTSNIIDLRSELAGNDNATRQCLNNDKFKFLFVGRMVRVKGVFDILTAIRDFAYKADCFFIFVGSGNDLPELEQYAHQLKISQYVEFTGQLSEEECDTFYIKADALLYPTFDSEGFPMALFKSVAAGLPVVTTEIRAAKDHLTANENVLWVKPQSPESILNAMSILYENAELRTQMSIRNKQLGSKFSKLHVCEGMGQVFLEK